MERRKGRRTREGSIRGQQNKIKNKGSSSIFGAVSSKAGGGGAEKLYISMKIVAATVEQNEQSNPRLKSPTKSQLKFTMDEPPWQSVFPILKISFSQRQGQVDAWGIGVSTRHLSHLTLNHSHFQLGFSNISLGATSVFFISLSLVAIKMLEYSLPYHRHPPSPATPAPFKEGLCAFEVASWQAIKPTGAVQCHLLDFCLSGRSERALIPNSWK